MNEQKDLPAGRQGDNNLATFIAGVVIGAALTYLFATKSGQKIKEQLLKDGAALLEKMGENVEEGVKKLEEVGQKVEEETQEVGDKIGEGAREVQSKVEETTSEIPAQVAEIQKKGRRFFFRRPRAES